MGKEVKIVWEPGGQGATWHTGVGTPNAVFTSTKELLPSAVAIFKPVSWKTIQDNE